MLKLCVFVGRGDESALKVRSLSVLGDMIADAVNTMRMLEKKEV